MEKTVLIVDDNEHCRAILGIILQSAGYSIIEARDGAQAIEKAIAGTPNLILMDLDLPDMTGIDAARALKGNSSTALIPILGCTAWSVRAYKEEFMTAGILDCLQKPFSADDVKGKIKQMIAS